MEKKRRLSWAAIFDELKGSYPQEGVVMVRGKRRYKDPITPRELGGYVNMYGRYEPERDSVMLWAFTGKTEDVHDEDDGSWGFWTQREMVLGKRNRQGEWIEGLRSVWVAE